MPEREHGHFVTLSVSSVLFGCMENQAVPRRPTSLAGFRFVCSATPVLTLLDSPTRERQRLCSLPVVENIVGNYRLCTGAVCGRLEGVRSCRGCRKTAFRPCFERLGCGGTGGASQTCIATRTMSCSTAGSAVALCTTLRPWATPTKNRASARQSRVRSRLPSAWARSSTW